MYSLRCLGEAALRNSSGDLIHFRSRKHLALLLYLALNADRAHRRERLAGLLWGESEDSRARHSLSQALYAVRRLLDGTIRIEGEDLELSGDGLWVDALELEGRLRSGDPIGAARLYRGQFLEGFWVRGAKAFEEWADRERARLGAVARDALRGAIQTARDHCEWAEVCQWAERLIQLDPFDETAYADWMRALWMAGDRTGALECYDRLRDVLSEELDTTPSPEIEELVARIRKRPARVSWDRVSQLEDEEISIFDHPPFVGRKAELAALAKEWEIVKAGRTRAVALVGEAGIGKTRLAQEFIDSLSLDDVLVLQGRCYEAERAIPYGPVGDALREAVSQLDLDGVSPYWLAELARLVPEIREHRSNIPEPLQIEPEGARRRLLEGISQVIRAGARDRATLIFVDDLQWADEATLALLHYILRRVDSNLLLIFAYRPEELSYSQRTIPWSSWFADHTRLVKLSPLADPERAELIRRLLGDAGEDRKLDRLQRLSGGNPFFASELARGLAYEAATSDGSTVPDRIRSLIARRLEHVGVKTLKILQQASILGTSVEPDTLRLASKIESDELDKHLVEAQKAGLVLQGYESIRFRHDIVRQVVREGISSERGKLLHIRAARALTCTRGAPGRIARHFSEGKQSRQSYIYALHGATAAENLFAIEEAAELLQLALEEAPTREARVRVLGRLGRLYWQLRQYERARPLLQQRLELLASPKFVKLDQVRARRDCTFIEIESGNLSLEECESPLLDLYRSARQLPNRDAELEVEILQKLFWLAARHGRKALAEDSIRRIRQIHDRLTERSLRWRTARILGIHAAYAKSLSEAEQLLQEAVQEAEKLNEPVALMEAYIGLSVFAARSMSRQLATDILKRALPLAEQVGDPARVSQLFSNAALPYLYAGDVEPAKELLNRAKAAIEGHGDYVASWWCIEHNLAHAAFLESDLDRAELLWANALEGSRRLGHSAFELSSVSGLGLVALQRGRFAEARTAAARAFRLSRRIGAYADDIGFLEELIARLRVQNDKSHKALARLAKVAEIALPTDRLLYVKAQRVRMELLASMKEWDAARKVRCVLQEEIGEPAEVVSQPEISKRS